MFKLDIAQMINSLADVWVGLTRENWKRRQAALQCLWRIRVAITFIGKHPSKNKQANQHRIVFSPFFYGSSATEESYSPAQLDRLCTDFLKQYGYWLPAYSKPLARLKQTLENHEWSKDGTELKIQDWPDFEKQLKAIADDMGEVLRGEAGKNGPLAREYYNRKKAFFIPGYLIIGALVLWKSGSLSSFYSQQSFVLFPRLLGCIGFSFLGFAFLIACSIRTHERDLGFPHEYIWYFPVLCCLVGVAAFSICQMFERTNGYLFNFTAYPLAFLLGFLVEVTIPLVLSKIKAYTPIP